tara:strand:- start:5593 stop:8109 length:2517 start_codon:yes stop_codon:yes gene_type:complete
MRIPTYRAQVSPTNEAPGQQIRTRYNANIAVQSQLDKAKPLNAALQEIGEFARVRYEMARDNLLNEATLAADEKIFEAFNDLKDSKDFNRVLDGDSPLWNQRMQKIKTDLQKALGKDKYSNSKFNAYFNQSELRNRFKLRGVIDTKVKQAQIQYSNTKHSNYNKNHGNKNVDFNEAIKDLTLLDSDAKSQGKHKVGEDSFFPYKNGSKKIKSTFRITAANALYDYVSNPENQSNIEVLKNVFEATLGNNKNADDSGVTKMLQRIIAVDGVEGKQAVDNLIRSAFKAATNFDKMSGTLNLESNLIKAQKEEYQTKYAEYTEKKNNLGDISKNGETIVELKEDLAALSSYPDEVLSKDNKVKLNQEIENLKIIEDQFSIAQEIQELDYEKKIEFVNDLINGVNLTDEYGINLNFPVVNTKNNEGLVVQEYAQKLLTEANKNLKANQDDLTSFAISEEFLFAKNGRPEVSIDMILGKSDENTKKQFKGLKQLALDSHRKFAINQNADINYLPQAIATELNNQVFAQSSNLGDIGVLQALYEHFEPLGIYDDVLRQLGKDEGLFVVGELIKRGDRKSLNNAEKIMSGLRSFKNAPKNIPPVIKNNQEFFRRMAEVIDVTLGDEMLETAQIYARAVQAYVIGNTTDLGTNRYFLASDALDEEKTEIANRLNQDIEQALQSILGQIDDGSGILRGGVQYVFSDKNDNDGYQTLVPDYFSANDVKLYINNFDEKIDANLLDNEQVDVNIAKDIRESENIKIFPVASRNPDENLYLVYHEAEDGNFLPVPILNDQNQETGKLLTINFDYDRLTIMQADYLKNQKEIINNPYKAYQDLLGVDSNKNK